MMKILALILMLACASAAHAQDTIAQIPNERVETEALPPGATAAQLQASLQVRWQMFQDEVNAHNPWVRYGAHWDEVLGWVPGGVS